MALEDEGSRACNGSSPWPRTLASERRVSRFMLLALDAGARWTRRQVGDFLSATAMLAPGCATGGIGPSGRFTPVADHRPHLFSPDIAALLGDSSGASLDADDLIPLLDSAASAARSYFGRVHVREPAARGRRRVHQVRAENDWTAAQVRAIRTG